MEYKEALTKVLLIAENALHVSKMADLQLGEKTDYTEEEKAIRTISQMLEHGFHLTDAEIEAEEE
tara:strand:- start:27483 stop:27677 length:195 start_codon:yes stop_codon:yes gene_type:complete